MEELLRIDGEYGKVEEFLKWMKNEVETRDFMLEPLEVITGV